MVRITKQERAKRSDAVVRVHQEALAEHERSYRLGVAPPPWVSACFADGRWPVFKVTDWTTGEMVLRPWTPPTAETYEASDAGRVARIREVEDARDKHDADTHNSTQPESHGSH